MPSTPHLQNQKSKKQVINISQRAQMICQRLLEGQTITQHKESGNSMTPLIKSRQPVTLSPILHDAQLIPGKSIVFCKVKGNFYTHKLTGIKTKNNKTLYQISNNHRFVNGWIPRDKIFGIVTQIG